MPLTVTTTALPPLDGGNSGGFYVPTTGRVYWFLVDGTSVACYSATLDDSSGFGSAAEVDSSNRPTNGSLTSIESLSVVPHPSNPNEFHIATFSLESGTTYRLEYHRFDATNTTNTANGSWEEVNTNVYNPTGVNNPVEYCAIAVRSDGDRIILTSGNTDRNMGTNYSRVYYTIWEGSSWSTPALIYGAAGDTVSYTRPQIVMGKNDLAHAFFVDGTSTWRTRSITSTNTLNTAQSIGTSFNINMQGRPQYYLSGTDELIYFTHQASDTAPQYNLKTNDGTPGSDVEMDDVGTPSSSTISIAMAINPDTGDLWAAYIDTSTSDLWRVDSSAWGTATEMVDAITAARLSVEVVKTDEDAIIMVATYAFGGWTWAEYYVITAGSGGGNTQAAAGSLTPAGALDLKISKAVAGTIAPSGALVKKTALSHAGSITPSGALGAIKAVQRAVAGSLAPAGALAVKTLKAVAGAIAPSGALVKKTSVSHEGSVTPAGAIVRKAGKALAGSITPTGALGRIKAVQQAVAGALSPSGTLVLTVKKALAGSIAPSGAETRKTGKALAGSVTPAGSLVKAITRSLAGSLAPAGTVLKRSVKAFGGAVAPAGALVKKAIIGIEGAVAPAGALIRSVSKTIAGSLTPSGALNAIKVAQQAVAGALAPAGTLAIKTLKAVAGNVTPSGTARFKTLKALAGSVTPTGALNAVKTGVVQQAVAGVLAPAGALVVKVGKAVSGAVVPAGDVAKSTSISMAGAIAPTGTLVRKAGKALAGSVPMAGAVATVISKAYNAAGTLPMAGALVRKVYRALEGAIDPQGAVSKQIARAVAGTLGLSGALSAAQNQQAVSGVLVMSGTLSAVYIQSPVGYGKQAPAYVTPRVSWDDNDTVTYDEHRIRDTGKADKFVSYSTRKGGV